MKYSKPTGIRYSKPANKKYVDLCIEFDKEFYTDNRDDYKLYKYMYLIYHMFACKKKFFKNFEDYDLFAQYAASTVYVRFLKKWRRGERVKSIKNYAEASCYPLKIGFQQEHFEELINPKLDGGVLSAGIDEFLKGTAQTSNYDEFLLDDIYNIIMTLPQKLKAVIERTPYAKSYTKRKNLYMSCLLTFLNSITISNIDKKRISEISKKLSVKGDARYLKLLEKERLSKAISWKNIASEEYITVLVNEVRYEISNELSSTKEAYQLPDDVLDYILSNDYLLSNAQDNYAFDS